MKGDHETRSAKHGEKMIEVRLRFWTDGLAAKDSVIPKHAWTGGVVRIEANQTHGIKPAKPVPFNSLMDVGAVVEKVLVAHGVILHPSRRMQKYIASE